MRKTIETRIPYLSLIGMKISDTQALQDRFMYLINNRVVLHNDQLNVDYIVLRVEVSEEIFSQDYKVRVVIDILDEIDKDIQRQVEQLRMSLGDLLPQKEVRNERRAVDNRY